MNEDGTVPVGVGGGSIDPDLIYGDGPLPTGNQAPVGLDDVPPGADPDRWFSYYYPPGTYIPGYGVVQPPRSGFGHGGGSGLPTWLVVAGVGVAAGLALRALSR